MSKIIMYVMFKFNNAWSLKNQFSASIEVTFSNLKYSLFLDIRILDTNFHKRNKTAANHIKESDFIKKSFQSKENI